jgi:hypothetical protein
MGATAKVARQNREDSSSSPFRALRVRRASLIGTPKRLEIAVNQTKQSLEVRSNRDKITLLAEVRITSAIPPSDRCRNAVTPLESSS